MHMISKKIYKSFYDSKVILIIFQLSYAYIFDKNMILSNFFKTLELVR